MMWLMQLLLGALCSVPKILDWIAARDPFTTGYTLLALAALTGWRPRLCLYLSFALHLAEALVT